MPSFDVTSEVNKVELRNAIDQSNKEISTRFDFKGSDARVEQSGEELAVFADSDFQLGQVRDVLVGKLAKRNVDLRYLVFDEKPEKIGSDKLKCKAKVRSGVESADSRRIVALVKESKAKVTASIQGDAVRVTGAKKDALQECMAMLRTQVTDIPITFDNFRD